jgi:hypothetical protein
MVSYLLDKNVEKLPPLFGNAIVYLSTTANPIITISDLISDLFLKQTELLLGLYDTGLLGTAYKAFNWTEDTEYNELRRNEIKNEFLSTLKSNSFFISNNKIYIALSSKKIDKWMNLVHSIASMKDGEVYTYKNQVYKATSSIKMPKKPIQDQRLLNLFTLWFNKTEKR